MANWIKAIYFVVILAWVIYVLSDDAVKYKSCIHVPAGSITQGEYDIS